MGLRAISASGGVGWVFVRGGVGRGVFMCVSMCARVCVCGGGASTCVTQQLDTLHRVTLRASVRKSGLQSVRQLW